MRLHEYSDGRTHIDPLRAQMGRLIEMVGTPRFEAEVFRLARNALDCDHLTAFAATDGEAPRVLFAANAGTLPVARVVAQKYVTHYWRFDPANRIDPPSAQRNDNIALSTEPNDITDGSYRRDCYTSVKLRDRFSVIRRTDNETIRVNFYRGARGTSFDTVAIDCILNSADLLLSLIVKHALDTNSSGDRLSPKLSRERLRRIEPTMPVREVEVCDAIVQGMTSEAIALSLGISVNTVLTYRKRAYTRLGISCQNELIRLILS